MAFQYVTLSQPHCGAKSGDCAVGLIVHVPPVVAQSGTMQYSFGAQSETTAGRQLAGVPLEPLEPLVPLEPLLPLEPLEPLEPLVPLEPLLPFESVLPLEPLVPPVPFELLASLPERRSLFAAPPQEASTPPRIAVHAPIRFADFNVRLRR